MINLLRRHQRWLLLLIAIVTILAFAWLYNDTDLRQLGSSRVAQIYGRTIYQPEIDRIVRLYQLASLLQLNDFLASLTLTASSPDDAINEFILNYFILRHEADALWLQPTDQLLLQAIRSLPSLQTNGTFDRNRYLSLLQNQLAPRGLSERHLEQLIRDSLRLERLRSIVTSPVSISPADIAPSLQLYQKTDIVVVKIPPLEKSNVPQPTDQEIQNYYDSHRAQFRLPTRRTAQIASFALPDDQKQLEGKPRIEALQQLANKATQFQEAASQPGSDFATLAQAHGAALFTRGPIAKSGREFPPTLHPPLPPFALEELFRISPDAPISDVIQHNDAFLVLRLLDELPEQDQPLDACRDQIIASLIQEKNAAADRDHANSLRQKVLEAAQAGIPLADAARQLGLLVEQYLQLEPWQASLDLPGVYARVSAEMAPGETSPVASGPDGYAFIHLLRRHPIDPELLNQKLPLLQQSALQTRRTFLFAEWLRNAREKAKIRFYQN